MIQHEMGRELNEHNKRIVRCISLLKEQRDELAYIIDKQYEERRKLETEMERITYKLCLINRSLGQRLSAKGSYDKTLTEIEEKYHELVRNSSDLLKVVEKEFEQLGSIIDKKTSTDNTLNDDQTEQKTCCVNCDKNCEASKDLKPPKSIRKATQATIIEAELPTKLEKNDNESVETTNISSGGNQDVDQEEGSKCGMESKSTKETKDDESDEGSHSYTLQFRKYS